MTIGALRCSCVLPDVKSWMTVRFSGAPAGSVLRYMRHSMNSWRFSETNFQNVLKLSSSVFLLVFHFNCAVFRLMYQSSTAPVCGISSWRRLTVWLVGLNSRATGQPTKHTHVMSRLSVWPLTFSQPVSQIDAIKYSFRRGKSLRKRLNLGNISSLSFRSFPRRRRWLSAFAPFFGWKW